MLATMTSDNPLQLSNSVDLLQNRARIINERTLDSTRRMVGVVDDAKEIGVRTLVAMDEQGEKMKVLDETNRELREEIRQSEKALTDMEKCCGIFVWPWNKSQPVGDGKAWKRSKEDKVVNSQPQKVTEEKDGFQDGLAFPRILNDASEDEMESNLAHVHSTVGSLKSMAADLRSTAYAHNKQLDKLVLQAETNDEHVQAAVERTDKLHK